ELESPAVGRGGGEMRAVARARVAEEAAESRAPRVPLARHQDEGGGFTEQKPAAPPVERPDALPGERAERVEAAHHETAEDVVAAGHDAVGGALAQEVGGEAERRRPGRARRGDRQRRPTRS